MDGSNNNNNNQLGVSALGQTDTGLMQKLSQNPELFSIILDMLGSGIAPDNPFAGIGSALAKSSIASKAEEERTEGFDQTMKGLLESMTGADKAGPTALNVTRDPSGAGYLYNVKGFEEGAKKIDETAGPTIRSAEDFVKDFGGGGV